MDEKTLKEKIKIAHEAVKDEKDPIYKLEAFKIILQNLLTEIKSGQKIDNSSTENSQLGGANDMDVESPLLILSKKCEIGLQELKNVLDYENNEFVLLKKIEGTSDVQKKIIACQIIVTAYMKGKNVEWVKGSLLHEFVKKHALGDTSGISKNLIQSGFFRTKGQSKAVEYSLTTQGWQGGLKVITKLAEGN